LPSLVLKGRCNEPSGAPLTTERTDWKAWLAEGKVGPVSAATACVAIYCIMQVLVLSLAVRLAGTGVGIDDAEQLVYLPYLWAGYGGSQPPLYTWLNWIASAVLGIDVLTLKLVKYACLFTAALCVYAATRRLGFRAATAATASLGLFLIPQIVWESQRALSHSVAAICFSALAFFAFAVLGSKRTILAYACFGLAAAAAILAKYNDVILLGALLAAALSLRDYRPLVLDRRFLVTVVVACLALTPTLLWNVGHPGELMARSYKFGISAGGRSLVTTFHGLWDLAIAVFNFAVLPVAVFLISAVIGWFQPPAAAAPASGPEKLLWRTLAFGLAAVLIFVVVSGATEVRDRWFLPILFLLPAAVAATMERFGERGWVAQLAAIRGAVMVVVLATPALWYAQIYTGDGQGRIARLDYPALQRAITARGPVATVLSDWLWIGNLRLVDKDLVLLADEVPDFPRLIREPAVLVWIDNPAPASGFTAKLSEAGYAFDGPVSTTVIHEKVGDGARKIGFVRLKRTKGAGTTSGQDK
jgi:4-amino-4-deoxy-L-arabinose transferase-like glycosyltransferase